MIDVIENSTPASAIYRILDPDWEWSLTNHLLAQLIDMYMFKSWSEGGRKGPRPKPIPRPGITEQQKKSYTVSKPSTMAEIDEWLKSRTTS